MLIQMRIDRATFDTSSQSLGLQFPEDFRLAKRDLTGKILVKKRDGDPDTIRSSKL